MLQGDVLPGVTVNGIDVGNVPRAEARRRLAMKLPDKLARRLTVVVGERRLTIRGDELFEPDPDASARVAFRAGRRTFFGRLGAELAPFLVKHDVDAVVRVRPAGRVQLVRRLAGVTTAPVDASIRMRGGAPVVTPAQTGTAADVERLLGQLAASALGDGAPVRARVDPAPAALSTAAAERAATEARSVVSAPVRLFVAHARVGAVRPKELAALVRFRAENGRFVLSLDPARFARVTKAVARARTRSPRDATFRVVGKRVRVVPSRSGVRLDASRSANAVLSAALRPYGRVARLHFAVRAPELTTREARALGIRRQLVTYTTQMGDSSANRIHNVHLMADYIDGTIIRAGKTFSFNKVVGPRTPERGFVEGQMIIGSLLVPSIGGGVCQTATTLFNDAFEAGLPIVERHNHSWYISHYPIGRDATVSWGGPDLVFRNDLRHAILIKASYTDATLTFTFYGTPQRRRVISKTGPQSNFRAPTMSYAIDPNAPAGSVRVEQSSNESGFDVTVERTVYERGRVLRRDSFRSRYVPVGPTTVYGPGAHPPGPYFVLPASA